MSIRWNSSRLGKVLAGIFSVGLIGGLAATRASAADDSASYAGIVSGTSGQAFRVAALPVLPGAVRATRTPHQPAPPPAVLNVSDGKIVYLKSHHRNPVMQFTIRLSKAVNKKVRVNYFTAASDAESSGEFRHLSGTATFGAGTRTVTLRIPIIAPLTTPNDAVFLDLQSPTNAVIGDGQGAGLLVSPVGKPHLR